MTWGNPHTLVERLAIKLLSPLTLPYQGVIDLRQLAYKNQLLSSSRLSKPVISVGNLSVGGTGKTPIIIDLANRLIANNIKVGILTRGYKRSNATSCTVVGDGHNNFASIEESGDEPLMMARMLPKAVVIANKDRFIAGQKAISKYDCEILLLDDGFQHLPLERDYDIVLLDYDCPPWNDTLLPVGSLREPGSALKRAQHVVITKIPSAFEQAKIDKFKSFVWQYSPSCKISLCRFQPVSIEQEINEQPIQSSLDKIKGLPVIIFSGIAKPYGFKQTVLSLGANILKVVEYDDHYNYSVKDIEQLEALRKSKGAEYFLTTAKDMVKLSNSPINSRLMAINLQTQWIGEPFDLISLIKLCNMQYRTI